MLLPVALTTTGAAALINFWLGVRIGQLRIGKGISVGDGGNPRLLARMRAHANFAEYVPIVLILIALIEFAVGSQLWLWIVAAVFVLGRILHGFGMDGAMRLRQIGIATTMLIMVGLALFAAWTGLQSRGAPEPGTTVFRIEQTR
ncbi:MAPEG family protein [Sphingomonas sp. S2-65]|uniref:MAPEG family protein n=1 Tax=Sphingomonas sp. S2-65 TaxID=2903960 RepID=UPI001F1A115F|nr:MAPEG family protein [Sphingomonas sp. S2-65]UYY57268.1 MAPEG family protein [Sphingomonas sp. S2-65]